MNEECIIIATGTAKQEDHVTIMPKLMYRYARSEAINIIAKALCYSWVKGGCQQCRYKCNKELCQHYIDGNKRRAELVLNSLLGKAVKLWFLD